VPVSVLVDAPESAAMTTSRPSPADPSPPAKVEIVMSLGLRPEKRSAIAGAVVTGKLADRPSDSDGQLLLRQRSKISGWSMMI